ncbi:peptidase inhibitor family I36 protein [Prosthecobacter sp.]|uniref:peptidase inhibitor family I36 protein n=1 Tax=Prosthecobacter sp. TaxID=1965333 RepID=UPI0037852A23
MKLPSFALIATIGLALTSCAGHLPNTSPAYYNPNCYANVYEHPGFRGGVLQLTGPSSYSSLKMLQGRDWDNTIGSVQTGPGCWIVLYKDKDFRDKSMVIGPNTTTGNLGDMNDQAESIKIFDRPPY